MVSRIGCPGKIEKPGRSPVSASGRIPGARARLGGGAAEMREIRRKKALVVRMAPESFGADPRPFDEGAPGGSGSFAGHTEFVSRPGFLWPSRGCVSLVLVCLVRVRRRFLPSRAWGGFVSLSLRGSRLVLVSAAPRVRWIR